MKRDPMSISLEKVQAQYERPLFSLVEEAHTVLKKYFNPGDLQTSQLLSIKTGGCSEDCAYCSQSIRYQTGLEVEALLPLERVVDAARQAKANGATRFCMGASWREVRDGAHFDRVLEMIRQVKAEGLQVCCTLGMVSPSQAQQLKAAGLYAYNHNIDTSEAYYQKVITTRNYQDRLRTIETVRAAGITVCTGGILGMGESDVDRVSFIHQLASLVPQPESVTINKLVPVSGTPFEHMPPLSALVLLRVISVARILIPRSVIRLSAGRESLSHAEQFLLFYAGANSVFLGDKLLTAPNSGRASDEALFEALDLQACCMGEES